MAKKKIVTTEEIDEQQAAQPEMDQPPTPEELEMTDFIQSVAPDCNIIKVYKIEEGKQSWCFNCEPQGFSEDLLRTRYPEGGKFFLRFMVGSHYAGGKTLLISKAPADFKIENRPDNPGGNYAGNSFQGEINIMREQINRQHEMLLKMLDRPQQAQQQISMKEILDAVASMQAMSKPPDISGMLEPILGLFGKSMELAKDSVEGGDSKMQWYKIISDAVGKLPAILQSMNPMKRSASMAAMETLSPAEAAQEGLKQGIAWLKKKALAGKDPDLQVDFILDNFDNDQFKNMGMLLLNQPFESFGTVDPEIMQEPLRTWFKKVYDGLKEEISEGESTNADTKADSGPGRIDANAARNEAPDD